MKLTKRKIDSFQYDGDGKSRDMRWDDTTPGFGVRIYPSGRKAFVLSYRTGGSKRLLTLGTYGAPLTLDEARTEAIAQLGKVKKDKVDPLIERQTMLRKGREAKTFGELADLYLEHHARKKKKVSSAKEDERIINRELLPSWGSRKVEELRRGDVIDLIDKIHDRGTPIMANRTLALARKIFNVGIERDKIEFNPCTQVKMPAKEQQRQRVLSDDEICTQWTCLDRLGPIMGALFKLRLLTAQRGGEVASMRWENIDGEWWTTPAERAKNGLSHRVPLSPQALSVLKDLEQYRHASGWVFPSPKLTSDYITSIHKATKRLKKASGIEDFRPHDLRRTAASRMAGLGVQRLVISKILNHVESGVTAVYDRHSYDPEKRHALDLWGQRVEKIIAGEKLGSNVVELTRTA